MVGMASEKFLNALAVDPELFFQGKEEAHQRKRQLTFSIGQRRATAKLGGPPKEFHPSRTALGAPQVPAMEEFFPPSFAGLLQSLRAGEALDKHPGTERSPVLKSVQRRRVILGQGMAQLANKGGALFNQSHFIATQQAQFFDQGILRTQGFPTLAIDAASVGKTPSVQAVV